MNAEACISDSEQAGDEDEDEETEEGKEQVSADGESKADEHEASAANQPKVRGSCVLAGTFNIPSSALMCDRSVSVS